MTGEEKFQVDLQGYLVIKNVLTEDEVAEMNAFIDRESSESLRGHGDRVSSLWGEPFKSLIDHPKILPYLLELLGPHVRLDHDYAIFMDEGQEGGRLHGGEDGGGPGGPEADHWYKYRDGVMRKRIVCDVIQSGGCPRRCRWIRLYPRQPQEQLFAGLAVRCAAFRASCTLRCATACRSGRCVVLHGSPCSRDDDVAGKTSTPLPAL